MHSFIYNHLQKYYEYHFTDQEINSEIRVMGPISQTMEPILKRSPTKISQFFLFFRVSFLRTVALVTDAESRPRPMAGFKVGDG